jgi:hypothetical protein
MSGNIKDNVTRSSIWLRLFFMIVLCIAYGVAELVTSAVVVFQFLASLFTGKPNDRMAHFGRNLARYFQQIMVYMTFATEEKPFPFAPWPDEPHEEAPVEEDDNRLNGDPENTGDAAEDDAVGDAQESGVTEADDDAEEADKPKE